jgi:hypothetical protein
VTEKVTLFRADLFTESNAGTVEQHAELIQQLKTLQVLNPGMTSSNPGCYRIEFPIEKISWLIDKISVLLLEAVTFYNNEDSVFKNVEKTPNARIVCWANINAPGSRNTFHTHKEDDFSGVLYLQGTDCGDLRFPNPANILGDCGKTSPFMRDFSFSPQDGDLVLWPSWLAHEVEPNLSTRERINLAFNIRIRA